MHNLFLCGFHRGDRLNAAQHVDDNNTALAKTYLELLKEVILLDCITLVFLLLCYTCTCLNVPEK